MTDTSYTATFKFHCPPERIFEALTDVRDVMRYTQSPGVKIEAKPGGVYSIFEGSILGEFEEATPDLVVLKWRLKNWEAGCFSKVVIRCARRGDDSTVVTLEHTGIPLTDAHGHGDQAKQAERGWRERIFLAMSRFVGLPMDKDED